ncbi:hypothetical protein [[Eubacterium] cellulosolvens]
MVKEMNWTECEKFLESIIRDDLYLTHEMDENSELAVFMLKCDIAAFIHDHFGLEPDPADLLL